MRSDPKHAFGDMQIPSWAWIDSWYREQNTWCFWLPNTPDYILRMVKCPYENCGSSLCSCLSHAPPLLFNVMLLCKCQIQMMTRKVTICILFVRLLSANQKGWFVAVLLELIVYKKTLIYQMGILCAIVWIFWFVCKSKIASFVMRTICSFNTLHTQLKYLFEHNGLFINYYQCKCVFYVGSYHQHHQLASWTVFWITVSTSRPSLNARKLCGHLFPVNIW